ncbi:phosphoribosylaminoimidazole-succinocarboxamide synthase [Veillonella montpellierensis DNF00314]|uniref:Phosphoribosylaminoimidazole-succinocarboxamide synthase n=1 Tax=Veillonella montpellierensis DNF00314 TaxID=1401067 RepID=A0A096AK35_9FIRM|nr:phosphoribosylaminoimidazolesuccinocarboxamide synthase [Veillonella montpellierensis]KGF47463.1 phosphoribosylaminoimidazole-succinocarboxamide synthase [Veillonella montpellierensis DNF00314]
MKEYVPFKSGKVRELYDLDDSLLIVCTDRISAFDTILKDTIPQKGAILNKMSLFWLDFTRDTVPNHMISVNLDDMPEYFQRPEFKDKTMLVKKLEMIPVECIVRGYITGSAWESYQKDGHVCGISLPSNLQECEKLPEPIFTPSTKAPVGEHDMNISMEEGEAWINQFFPGKGKEYMDKLAKLSLLLYYKCADYALTRGIIIADTKFEFGLDEHGEITLGDEILTPDNSRFWPLKGYEVGHGQPSYDKQFVRDYLKAHPSDTLPQEIIDKTIDKYKEAYYLLTGFEFE